MESRSTPLPFSGGSCSSATLPSTRSLPLHLFLFSPQFHFSITKHHCCRNGLQSFGMRASLRASSTLPSVLRFRMMLVSFHLCIWNSLERGKYSVLGLPVPLVEPLRALPLSRRERLEAFARAVSVKPFWALGLHHTNNRTRFRNFIILFHYGGRLIHYILIGDSMLSLIFLILIERSPFSV